VKCPDCETSDCAFCLEAERLAARVKELEEALRRLVSAAVKLSTEVDALATKEET
jgi:hypothetical protein